MDILLSDFLGKPMWMWAVFFAVVVLLLIFDLGILHRKTHEINIKESLWMSVFYIMMGVLFGAWIWYELGAEKGQEYFTGFVVEKTLSLDNVFVISLVFTYFAIPRLYQHRVLFWGILGVIVLRGIMISVGTSLIQHFHSVLYIFGAFLIYTGFKMFKIDGGDDLDISKNFILKLVRKKLRVTDELHGQKFFVKKLDANNKFVTYCTPLFVALIVVEFVDVIFAVDSVPAIFAITLDPYIIFTSNIFAILGLRALYFALAAIVHRFKYLKLSLAVVLIFIGTKIFWVEIFDKKFPPVISFSITAGLIVAGILYSLYKTKSEEQKQSN